MPIPVYVPSPSYVQCSTIDSQASCIFFSSSTLPSTRQCAYASSGCDKKKITLYRNFFRNLNFKNTVNFFKRTCCRSSRQEKTIYFFQQFLLTILLLNNRRITTEQKRAYAVIHLKRKAVAEAMAITRSRSL